MAGMSGVLLSQYADLPQIPVSSTNVAAFAYADDFDRMYVEYLNGSVYAYETVSAAEWSSALNAASKGGWVDKVLKKGQKAYRRVR